MWMIMRERHGTTMWVLFNVRVEGGRAQCITMLHIRPDRSMRDMGDMANDDGVHDWEHTGYELEII